MYAIDLLEQALSDPVGLRITTPEPTRLRNRLYNERQKQQNKDITAYDNLGFFKLSESEVWIVHLHALEEYRDENLTQNFDETLDSLISGGR